MKSIIFTNAVRILLPILLLFSIFTLLRGHDAPGGGFVGGLVASVGLALHALAFGARDARRVLWADPRALIAAGLLSATVSGLFGIAADLPFMAGIWAPFKFEAIGGIGTPLLFDIGVYLTVTGVMLLIIFSLMEQ